MTSRFSLPMILLTLLVQPGCVNHQDPHAMQSSITEDEMVEHPLAGSIVTASGEQVAQEDLLDRIAAADVVFLGELHDNPDHHMLQGQVVQAIVDRGLTPAIGLEMIAVTDSSAALSYTLAPDSTHEVDNTAGTKRIRQALDWQSDFTWKHYGPLLQQARSLQLPLFGIDLPMDIRRRISMLGLDGLTALERSQISTTGFSDDDYQRDMEQDFKAAHCGWGPADHLARLYDAWVARNDTMAHAITAIASEPENRPVLVVVGRRHTRYGMGPVLGVQTLAPGLNVLNLAMDEALDSSDPSADWQPDNGSEPAFEYIWYTRGVAQRPDHCAKYLEGK